MYTVSYGHFGLLTLPQGFQLRPLVFSDFFQADGTSALPPKEITLEAVLDKLVST